MYTENILRKIVLKMNYIVSRLIRKKFRLIISIRDRME
jgi:hypothetical protein